METELSTADALALRRLCEQYFYALDHNDAAAMIDCFAENCRYRVNMDPPVEMNGREEIESGFREPWNPRLFVGSNHTLSHHTLSVADGHVTGVAYAVAHLLLPSSGRKPIVVRGLRYDDEYVKEGGRWRMGIRIHNPLWQYEVAATDIGLGQSGSQV